jgi:vancomycin resistance protein YoaR
MMHPFPRFSSLLSLPVLLLAFLAVSPTKAEAENLPDLHITAGSYDETVPGATLASWVRLDTTRHYDPGYRAEIEDPETCPVGYGFCDFTLPRGFRMHLKTALLSSVDEDKLRSFLSDLAVKTDKDPEDAIFAGDENGRVIVGKPDVPGQNLDIEKSAGILRKALENVEVGKPLAVSLPVERTEAAIKAGDQERLGLKELIGEGTSNFKGSPKNRLYNIKRSLEQFQGVIVPAGEEFSFVEHLGPVDGEHGYLPELVIKDNKTEPEFGGGICQVSSTVFRAAIYSGMKITERRNHAYPVRYYTPYGMDATIYEPKPDFRFINNTGHAIFMQSHIEGNDLTFRFFGTSDGRKVSVDGPHILEHNPDGSMKTVFTQIVKRADGSDMIRDQFWSNYKSPSLYPHPGEEQPKFTSKPKDWSERQWKEYKKLNP